MAQFKSNPFVVDAVQWIGINFAEVKAFVNGSMQTFIFKPATKQIIIPSSMGNLTASLGDWIVKFSNGTFCPVKDDLFQKSYSPMEHVT